MGLIIEVELKTLLNDRVKLFAIAELCPCVNEFTEASADY